MCVILACARAHVKCWLVWSFKWCITFVKIFELDWSAEHINQPSYVNECERITLFTHNSSVCKCASFLIVSLDVGRAHSQHVAFRHTNKHTHTRWNRRHRLRCCYCCCCCCILKTWQFMVKFIHWRNLLSFLNTGRCHFIILIRWLIGLNWYCCNACTFKCIGRVSLPEIREIHK